MIAFLARLFRGVHYVVGISAPPPGTSERKFVLWWLAGIGLVVAVFVVLILVVPTVYFRR
jgi:hypothetical protein